MAPNLNIHLPWSQNRRAREIIILWKFNTWLYCDQSMSNWHFLRPSLTTKFARFVLRAWSYTYICFLEPKDSYFVPFKQDSSGLPRHKIALRFFFSLHANLFRACAIQHAHKYCIKTNMASIQRSFYLLNVLFCFKNEYIGLMVLLFYYKGMLEEVTMQRTQQFSVFVCYRKNPVKCSACVVSRKKLRLSEKLTWRYAYFSRAAH